jgi:SAM-dependent methyltransferase
VGVDLSARRGALAQALAQTAPGKVAFLIEADASQAMLADRRGPRLVLDDEQLPFAAQSLDVVVSVLSLHWANDVVGALIQARRALKPGGLFIAAILGGATLTELRQALTEAEVAAWGGAGTRVSPFASAQDGAELLQRAGFSDPVCDIDRVSVTYEHPLRLVADLRAMGESNALADRHPRALTRSLVGDVAARYAEASGTADGRVSATFEILTLTGWVPD